MREKKKQIPLHQREHLHVQESEHTQQSLACKQREEQSEFQIKIKLKRMLRPEKIRARMI